MRALTLILLLLIGAVHAELWFGKNGVGRVRELAAQVEQLKAINDDQRDSNARLAAEVSDLQDGIENIEEQARYELGMIRPDEILVQYTAAKR